jgi:hypothetical protein
MSQHQGVETKLFISAIIKVEDCTITRRCIIIAITLRYILALSHNALGLHGENLFSKFIAMGNKEPLSLLVVITLVTYSLQLLLKVIDLTAKQKR